MANRSFSLCLSFFSLVFTGTCVSQEPPKALEKYIRLPDTSYKWQIHQVSHVEDGSFYELNLVSQTWQHLIWTHRLIVYFPKRSGHQNTSVLVARHIYNRSVGLASLKTISDSTGVSSALIYDVPNQPHFNGREEDDLQAYTFSQYINSGDESWPLLFPMAKTIVRAMDAIQELSTKEIKTSVNRFVVAGHSKRGHATWLSAAVDHRIKGIIPMAIDVLNATVQLTHHLNSFGEYSTPSKEATDFLQKLKLPRGKSLIEMIDPYSYRERLTIPKLIVSATNDDFFPSDALNVYWDGLKGPKSILYLSNAGHVRADSDPRINNTAFAFIRAVAMDKTLPSFNWKFRQSGKLLHFQINADIVASKAAVWTATSQSRDFRKQQWSSTPMKLIGTDNIKNRHKERQFKLSIIKPRGNFTILYGEIEFVQDGHVFLLSTQCFVSTETH